MADRVGQQLGNYHLIRLIGSGNFGEVYLGEHVYLKTRTAIKVLQRRAANNDMQAFLTEAQTVAHLEHPHIVRIMDFGITANTPFLVMSYAPNGELRRRHPPGTRLPLATILSYVRQVADALQYAHNKRLIHRDVKPENMLLGRNNEVLLSDFGIAVVAHNTSSSSIQNMAGTIAYMAPEQLQGKPHLASDLYSLAVIVYEWLCGSRPFDGTPGEIITQHLTVSPPPLHEKVSSISPAIEQVVLQALAKDPKERFSSVQAFAIALAKACHAKQPISATQQPDLRASQREIPPVLQKPTEQWPEMRKNHFKAAQHQGVLLAYEQATQPDLDNASTHLGKGHVLHELKRYEEALVAYERAIQLDPDNAAAHLGKGHALENIFGRREEALEAYEQAIRLDPDNTHAYSCKADILLLLKRYDEALPVYGRVIEMNPNNTFAYSSKGFALNELKRYDEALVVCEHAIQLNPNNAQAYTIKRLASKSA